MQRLPKHLKNATPEEIHAYRIVTARKARMGAEEGRILFRLRMRREEKEADLDKLIAIYREQYGKSRLQAVFAAQDDLGYLGAEKERKEYIKAVARGMRSARRQKQSECQKRWRRNVKNKELFEAIAAIEKENAPPEVEMDWVAAHPKLLMALDQLNDDEADPVKIVASDIPKATTPSRSAVGRLMAAISDPLAWQKKRLDADKSKTQAGAGGESDKSDAIDDLSEIEQMIRNALKDE